MNRVALASRCPPLAVVRRGMRGHRYQRRWIADVAPGLAAGAVPGAPGAGWRTRSVTLTDTGVAVAMVSCDAAHRGVMVKIPYTASGDRSLRRQAEVLLDLHADARLADWCRVVPRHLGQGEVAGHRYWLEEAVPGSPVNVPTLRGTGRRAVLDAATGLIEQLHDRTAEPPQADPAIAQAWIDLPARRVERALNARSQPGRSTAGRLGAALDRLRAELHAAVAGHVRPTGWIHGDFWPGNLLVSGRAVTGVVDWDQATKAQLPIHDLLHAYALARRLVTREDLGDIVVQAVQRGISPVLGVPGARVERWLDGMSDRPAALLYWLRHVSLFIDTQGHGDNPRWLSGNVERVLARL